MSLSNWAPYSQNTIHFSMLAHYFVGRHFLMLFMAMWIFWTKFCKKKIIPQQKRRSNQSVYLIGRHNLKIVNLIWLGAIFLNYIWLEFCKKSWRKMMKKNLFTKLGTTYQEFRNTWTLFALFYWAPYKYLL